MKIKKVVLGVALTAGVVLSSLVVAVPANAYVSGCTTGFSTVGAFAQCGYSTSGYYKVEMQCQNRFTFQSRIVFGPAKRAGSQVPSTVTCEWYEHYFGVPHAREA